MTLILIGFVLIVLIQQIYCSYANPQSQTVFISTFTGTYFNGISMPNQAPDYGTFASLKDAVNAVNTNKWANSAIYLDNGVFNASGINLIYPVKILSRPGQPQSTIYCNETNTGVCFNSAQGIYNLYGFYNMKIISRSTNFQFIKATLANGFELIDCSIDSIFFDLQIYTPGNAKLVLKQSTVINSAFTTMLALIDISDSSLVNSNIVYGSSSTSTLSPLNVNRALVDRCNISGSTCLDANIKNSTLNSVMLNFANCKANYIGNVGVDIKIRISDPSYLPNVIMIDQSRFINLSSPIEVVGTMSKVHQITIQNSAFFNCPQIYLKSSGNYTQRMYNNSFYNDLPQQYSPVMCSPNGLIVASSNNKMCGNFPYEYLPVTGTNQPCIWNFEYWTTIDDCLVCDGNNRNKDCNGICFGPNQNCPVTRTWYVKAGSTGGDGSHDKPFGTIASAISVSNYKDSIALFPGTYKETNLQFYGKDILLRNLGHEPEEMDDDLNSPVILTSNDNILKFVSGDSGALIHNITFVMKENGIIINGSSPMFTHCIFKTSALNNYPIVVKDSFSNFIRSIFLSKGIGSISIGSNSPQKRMSLLSIYESRIMESESNYHGSRSSILVDKGSWADISKSHFYNYEVATSISFNNVPPPVINGGILKLNNTIFQSWFYNLFAPSPSGTIFCQNQSTVVTAKDYNYQCGDSGSYNGNWTFNCAKSGGNPLTYTTIQSTCFNCNTFPYRDLTSLCIEAGETICGDGVCTGRETQSNCFADCALEVKKIPVMERNPELFSGTLEHCYTSIPNSLTLPVNLQFTDDTLGNLINQQSIQKLPGLDHLAHGIDYFTGEEAVSPLFTFIYCSEDLKVYQDTYRGLNYYVPEQVQVNAYPKCSFDVETNSYESTSDFSQSQFEQTGISAEASGSFPIEAVTVGVSGGFSKEKSTEAASEVNTKRSGTLSSAQAKCLSTKLVLADIDVLQNSLHPDFLFDLSQTTDENSMIPLIKKYGTFYYKEATMGGKLVQMTSTSSSFAASSDSSSMEKSLSYNVGASVGGGDFSLSASTSKSSSVSVNSEYHNSFLSNSAVSDIVTYGGAPGSFGPGGGGDADTSDAPASWEDWASTIDFLPVPIEYQLGLVNDLIDKNWTNIAGRNIFALWNKTEIDHYNSLDYAKNYKSYRIQSFYSGDVNDARFWSIAINGSLGVSDYQYLLERGNFVKFKKSTTDSTMEVKDIGEFKSLHFNSAAPANDERLSSLISNTYNNNVKQFPKVLMTDQSRGVQWILKQIPLDLPKNDNKMVAVFDKPTNQFYITMETYRDFVDSFLLQIIVTSVDQTYIEITTTNNFFGSSAKRSELISSVNITDELSTTPISEFSERLTEIDDASYSDPKLFTFGSSLFSTGGSDIKKVGMLPPDIKHIRFEFLVPTTTAETKRFIVSMKDFQLTEFHKDSDTSYSSRVYSSSSQKLTDTLSKEMDNVIEFDLFPKRSDVSCSCTYCNKDRNP